jgi:hypothetical protein
MKKLRAPILPGLCEDKKPEEVVIVMIAVNRKILRA